MSDEESRQRAAVVAEARTWLGTPYHHEARLKGIGVDCAQLLAGIFSAPSVALIAPPQIPHYPPDWHLHRDAERYLGIILAHAREFDPPAAGPLPGDVVLWKFGRCFSHGAIVLAWPTVIHAYVGKGCVLDDVGTAPWLSFIGENGEDNGKPRPRRFFSYWPGAAA
jgi:NlpC/P60 family putative phage cell wall peptidase